MWEQAQHFWQDSIGGFGRKVFYPILTITIGFYMTTLTQSNAIFGKGIVLYVVNVMNCLTKFATNSASVIVSFANLFFELLVEDNWVRFERKSASPISGIFANGTFYITRTRTVFLRFFSTVRRSKFFSTKAAQSQGFNLSRYRMAFYRTITLCKESEKFYGIRFTTYLTRLVFFSSIPVARFFFDEIFRPPLSSAGKRTALYVWSRKFRRKHLTANGASFFHGYP